MLTSILPSRAASLSQATARRSPTCQHDKWLQNQFDQFESVFKLAVGFSFLPSWLLRLHVDAKTNMITEIL